MLLTRRAPRLHLHANNTCKRKLAQSKVGDTKVFGVHPENTVHTKYHLYSMRPVHHCVSNGQFR